VFHKISDINQTGINYSFWYPIYRNKCFQSSWWAPVLRAKTSTPLFRPVFI
jgi:hypothetical protein